MKKHARRGARQDAEGVCGFLSDRTAIQAGVEGTDHPVEQTDDSGKSRCKAEEQAAVRVGEPALRSEEQPSRAKDEKHLMLKRILAAHEQWFDVRRGYEYAGRIFPGYAEFHSYGEKYVLVKSAKLWEVDTHEYLFFVLADALDETQVRDLVSFMEHDGLKKVVPKPNHMSSAISLVIVADSCTQEAAKAVRKTCFRKNFALGIRGWADLRVAVADLSANRVITNAAGKQLKTTLEANLLPRS